MRLAAALLAACLLLTVLPVADAQPLPPFPPSPPYSSIACPGIYYPLLEWVDRCTPDSIELERFALWGLDMVDWLRCDVLGGSACPSDQ